MFNLKKILALTIVLTFLASIPLAIAQPRDDGVIQLIYTIRVDPNYAKPPGAGGSKPSADYKILYNRYQAEVPLTLTVYTTNGEGLSVEFVYDAVVQAGSAWDGATSKQLVGAINKVVEGSGAIVYNEENAVFFGTFDDNGIIAGAYIWINRITRQIVETDIKFNVFFAWGDGAANSALMDLQNIATHELGHAFNLADIYDANKSYLTMYGYSDEGDTAKRDLAAGDIAGIQKIYGL